MSDLTTQTIGTILTGEHERDAIHVAVMQVIAGEDWLHPGQGISIVYGTVNTVQKRELCYGGAHGVVDPFLTPPVRKGDRFWMFLLPGSTTAIRHRYTCPAIDNRPGAEISEHEHWLRSFADKWNFNYDELITQASAPHHDKYGNYIVAGGIDLHDAGELGEDHDLFWHHLSALTGQNFSDEHRKKFIWSCTC